MMIFTVVKVICVIIAGYLCLNCKLTNVGDRSHSKFDRLVLKYQIMDQYGYLSTVKHACAWGTSLKQSIVAS